MNAVRDKLPALVQEELDAANALHARFASAYEGYAVLLEECMEAEKEMEAAKFALDLLWANVRMDKLDYSMKNAAAIEKRAINLAAEAIQVAAMARKYQEGCG